jgi:hypothetical protein
MAKIVGAFAISHAAVMVRHWEEATAADRVAVQGAFDEIARRLRAARADALLVVGNDHFRNFFLDQMPAFCLGIGDTSIGCGDGGFPLHVLPVASQLADGLLEGLLARQFDLAFARNLPLDHAFIGPLHNILGGAGLPIVPLFQNCVAPPLPPLARYLALGAAIADVLAHIEPGLRVALLGTGGLSHEVPLPDWRHLPQDADGEDWLRFMSAGRSGADAETLQRIGAEVDRWGRERRGRIDAAFDRELLGWMQAGDYTRFADLDADTLRRRGGNGAQEVRNWVTVMGAMPGTRAELLAYAPVPAWLTGVAAVEFR